MSRTILHKRRHVFPVSRTVPFTASQRLPPPPPPPPPSALSSFAVAKALLCRRYPTNRGNRGRNNRFSSERRTSEGANEIAGRFLFFLSRLEHLWLCLSRLRKFYGIWMEESRRKDLPFRGRHSRLWILWNVCGMGRCRYWIVEFNWIHQWFSLHLYSFGLKKIGWERE